MDKETSPQEVSWGLQMRVDKGVPPRKENEGLPEAGHVFHFLSRGMWSFLGVSDHCVILTSTGPFFFPEGEKCLFIVYPVLTHYGYVVSDNLDFLKPPRG